MNHPITERTAAEMAEDSANLGAHAERLVAAGDTVSLKLLCTAVLNLRDPLDGQIQRQVAHAPVAWLVRGTPAERKFAGQWLLLMRATREMAEQSLALLSADKVIDPARAHALLDLSVPCLDRTDELISPLVLRLLEIGTRAQHTPGTTELEARNLLRAILTCNFQVTGRVLRPLQPVAGTGLDSNPFGRLSPPAYRAVLEADATPPELPDPAQRHPRGERPELPTAFRRLNLIQEVLECSMSRRGGWLEMLAEVYGKDLPEFRATAAGAMRGLVAKGLESHGGFDQRLQPLLMGWLDKAVATELLSAPVKYHWFDDGLVMTQTRAFVSVVARLSRVAEGHALAIVDALQAAGVDLDTTVLERRSGRGAVTELGEVSEGPECVIWKGTFLHQAIAAGSKALVAKLLAQGCDPTRVAVWLWRTDAGDSNRRMDGFEIALADNETDDGPIVQPDCPERAGLDQLLKDWTQLERSAPPSEFLESQDVSRFVPPRTK